MSSNIDSVCSVHEMTDVFGPTAKAESGASRDEAMGMKR